MRLSPELLTSLLREGGALGAADVADVEELERFPGGADRIVRLALTYRGAPHAAGPATLVAKVIGPSGYREAGRAAVRFAREVAPLVPPRSGPRRLGLLDDPDREAVVLLTEDLSVGYERASPDGAPAWLDVIADALAALHAAWWDRPELRSEALRRPEEGVTRMAQVLDAPERDARDAAARATMAAFLERRRAELSDEERALLARLGRGWSDVLAPRARLGHLTLVHGDVHVHGNVFVSRAGPGGGVRLIDWEQVKRGLGPHDVMTLLSGVPALDRVRRDTGVLRRYHAALRRAGVRGYPWRQCAWDYRASLLANLWQCVHQDSLKWLRLTVPAVRAWRAEALLDEPGAPRRPK